MLIGLMLVGYAASKRAAPKSSSWYRRLFGQKSAAAVFAPPHNEAQWELGAEAWVTLPASARRR
jgi:hypothetical protein